MMRLQKQISCVLCALIIAGCGGREAQKISVVQDGDFARDCDSLHLEAKSLDSQVKTLLIEHAKKQGNNTALTVVSVIIFLPALFALDLKGAAKAEFEALHERSKHLANVAENRGCEPIHVKTLDEFKEEIAAEKKAENPSAPAGNDISG